MGAGRLLDDQIRAMPRHPGLLTEFSDEAAQMVGQEDFAQLLARFFHPDRKGAAFRCEPLDELPRIGIEFLPQGHHGHALFPVQDGFDFHAQAETVEQLRPQLPFLGIHGAYQDKAGGMGKGNPFAFEVVLPRSGGIQNDVHQVIIQ